METQIENSCPSCGSKIGYSAEKRKIACDYCGYTEALDTAQDEVEEQSLQDAMERAAAWQPVATTKLQIKCSSCGSSTLVEGNNPNINCSFCGSKNINQAAFQGNFIQPVGIIPFFIHRKLGEMKFTEWIGSGWFHPSELSQKASLRDLRGVYIPFWTYDAQTETEYQGESGHHYYETIYTRDSEGNQVATQIQRTRWVWQTGHISHFFDDILIVASKGVQPEHIKGISPFKLESVINYDPRLLLNWEAEVYGIEVDKGYEMASREMDSRLYNIAASRLGGDTYRNLNIDVEKSYQTFKHLLLPVWLCAYTYNGKIYQFAINGQTGKVTGDKPYSTIKIAFAVILGLIVLAAIFYLYTTTQGSGHRHH